MSDTYNKPTAKAVALDIASAIGRGLLWLCGVTLASTIATWVLLNWFIGCAANDPEACFLVPWVTTEEMPQ